MKKEQNLRYVKTTTIIGALTVFLLVGIVSENIARAQAPYIRTKTAIVMPYDFESARTFCNDGDGIISGGYSIRFISVESIFDTMLYSNHPAQEVNETGYFEGWEAGIVNKGNETVGITATSLCLNLTLTP